MCLYDSQGFFFLCYCGGLVCLRGRVKVGLGKYSEDGQVSASCANTSTHV